METDVLVFLEQRITICQKQQKRLKEEDCKDEASFEKIKANVYEIFKTILSNAIKKYGGDCTTIRKFFMDSLEQIPSSWVLAYERAEKYNDIKKMHIENIKLNAIRDIKENILEIWREKE